jgi:hypothetical protein
MKEIDDGAFELMLQAIQEDIYSYPIKSFVREAISNGLDANVEKNNYHAIRNGDPVDKYYRPLQDGKLLKDSEFEPEYYTDKWLSVNDTVAVQYLKPGGTRRHKIIITDYGVGLGGSRLQGFFKIGYSTKRNLKNVFGKWGSGAKAGLATGADYFLMRTNYNGWTTAFMIFKTDYEGITPQHPDGKSESWKVKTINGDEMTKSIYWQPTHEKNGVTIELEVKPHNEKAFCSAVTDQFEHFDGKVVFTHQQDDGSFKTNPLNDKPLFESDSMLIPTTATYVSPTMLVDKISYGPIVWEELDLERRPGALALKVHATDVDITQSRESLKWTEKTKAVILKAIATAEEEATDHISQRMVLDNIHDIFEVITKHSSVSRSSSDAVSRAFAKFLNLNALTPKYIFNPDWFGKELTVPIGMNLFEGLFYSYSVKNVSIYLDNHGTAKIRSKYVDNFHDLADNKIVFTKDSNLGPKLANHLINNEFVEDSFIYIRPRSDRMKTAIDIQKGTMIATRTLEEYTRKMLLEFGDIDLDEYEFVQEPAQKDLDGEETVVVARETLASLRRKNEEVLFRYKNSYNTTMHKTEVKISGIKDLIKKQDGPVVLCTADYKEYGALVESLSYHLGHRVSVWYVSKSVLRDFTPFAPFVTDFIRQYNPETKELVIADCLRDFNTNIKVEKLEDQYSDVYDPALIISLSSYFKDNFNDLYHRFFRLSYVGATEKDRAKKFLSDLTVLQKKIDAKKSCKKLSKELFNVEISLLDCYDKEYLHHLEETLKDLTLVKPLVRLRTHNENELDAEQKELFKTLINNTKNN